MLGDNREDGGLELALELVAFDVRREVSEMNRVHDVILRHPGVCENAVWRETPSRVDDEQLVDQADGVVRNLRELGAVDGVGTRARVPVHLGLVPPVERHRPAEHDVQDDTERP